MSLSDGGYLDDPDSEWGRYSNPDVVLYEIIERFSCLGLLGEPGMGKTHTMQAQRSGINQKIEEEGGQTLWLELGSYRSEDRLIRDLFASEAFIAWTQGGHHLHIFLDSLDECLLRIDTVAALLGCELQKYSDAVQRLYLRIACRTAAWPSTLEETLCSLWGKDLVEVYELAPLRRKDVIEAAKANGVNADAFLREVDHKAVVPLAMKPVTLGLLLNIYRRNGGFPSTQTELYRQGCRVLCEETNASRRDARLAGTLTAEQRMAVAARIAAVTVFANRYAVWTGPDVGDVSEEDVAIGQLSGGKEATNGNDFEVGEAAVREALDTGIFSSRGPHRMGWAHQSYAEFLAAHYLVHHHMPLAQMMSLLVHHADPEHKLVPQLDETAAWLAGMMPEVFREIMSTDPDVPLRSDVATTDVHDRAALVGNLLRLYDEERLLDRDWSVRRQYKKLAHPGLAEQLRPYVCDKMKGITVRGVAIDIAEACHLQILQQDLGNVALDSSQPLSVRVKAAAAVSRIGDEETSDEETKARLKVLARGEGGDDPEDELKGWALCAVWPAHLTAMECFACLTLPKREDFSGTYQMFLWRELVPHLQTHDLPVALQWVSKQSARRGRWHPFAKTIDSIMLKAIYSLEEPGIVRPLARALLSRLRQYDESDEDDYRGVLGHDEVKRRQLLKALLPMLPDPERDWIWPFRSRLPLVHGEDAPWMLRCFRAARSLKMQRLWIQLIRRACDWYQPEALEQIYTASQNSPMLAEAFAGFLQPIVLDSPEAQHLRAAYLEEQEWQTRTPEQPLLQPSPAERMISLLEACESGDVAQWWQLTMVMMLEPDSTHYPTTPEYEPDLTVLPGWQAADPATKIRIVETAKHYLLEQGPEAQKWLGTETLHRPAFAGYKALRLLLREAPQFVSTLPVDVWKRWAPIILAFPTASVNGGTPLTQELVKLAYQVAPDEIITTLLVLIDQENRTRGRFSMMYRVEGCWDHHLAQALLAKAKDETLTIESLKCLLAELLDHGGNEAKVFAEALIPLPLPASGNWRARAIVAACMLIAHADDAGWSIVWPAMQQDTAFGRDVFSGLAQSGDEFAGQVGQTLTEDQLTELYLWAVRQYPYAEDPPDEGVHQVGPRDILARWGDGLLRQLKERGTAKACEVLCHIMRELPELDWLKWVLLEAQDITRRRTWVPPRPSHILKIASHSELRLVQSGEQLLEVVVESLNRLESKLQGETPAAQFLWDKVTGENAWRPKDENSFSDYVKIHLDENLKQRGVIVNREVEIRRGTGPSLGERTDIHVDAVARDPDGEVYDSVTVIIEVKGCWHQELNHAMETQLVDRYLKDNRCQHGLYLVGWFNCDQWDECDYRKKQVSRRGIAKAQQAFDSQAESLSQEGVHIKGFVLNMALR